MIVMDLPQAEINPVTRGPKVLQRKPKKTNPAQGTIKRVKRNASASPAPKVIARKAEVKPPTNTKSMCPAHHKVFVYDAITGFWKCPEDGCRKRKRASMSAQGIAPTVVKGDFRVIASQDSDGDWNYHLHYDALNVVVELPYQAVIGHKVYNTTIDSKVVVNVMSRDVVFIDKDGKVIPIADVEDR